MRPSIAPYIAMLALALGGAAALTGIIAFVIHQVLLGIVLLLIGAVAVVAGILSGRRPAQTFTAPPRTIPVAPPPQPAAPAPIAAAPVQAPPVVAPAPPAPVVPTVPTVLPAPGPLFIGREQELDDLVSRMRRVRASGAIAVVGPSGVGRQSLITQAVEQHRAEGTFPDGLSWHACTDFSADKGLRRLLLEILDRFGGPAVAMTSTLRIGEAAVTDLVRGKRILFWLDDVPADFPLGRAISALTARNAAGEGPTLIISSRLDWDMPEVSEILLDLPQLDEALDLLRGWMDLAGRSTDYDDYDALKAICTNLSSLPLALRLAAGLAAQTGAALPRLAADLGSAVYPPGDPLRTAERTIAYVVNQLFPQAQLTFAALGVFDTPIVDLDMAAAVAAAASGTTIDDARDDITAMGLIGLVEADGTDYAPQIRLHPLVRQHATARLTALGTAVVAKVNGTLASIYATRRAQREGSDEAASPLISA